MLHYLTRYDRNIHFMKMSTDWCHTCYHQNPFDFHIW